MQAEHIGDRHWIPEHDQNCLYQVRDLVVIFLRVVYLEFVDGSRYIWYREDGELLEDGLLLNSQVDVKLPHLIERVPHGAQVEHKETGEVDCVRDVGVLINPPVEPVCAYFLGDVDQHEADLYWVDKLFSEVSLLEGYLAFQVLDRNSYFEHHRYLEEADWNGADAHNWPAYVERRAGGLCFREILHVIIAIAEYSAVALPQFKELIQQCEEIKLQYELSENLELDHEAEEDVYHVDEVKDDPRRVDYSYDSEPDDRVLAQFFVRYDLVPPAKIFVICHL